MNIPQKFHGIKSERGDIDKRGVDDLHHHHHHHDTVQFPKLIQEISTAQDLKTSWETINGPKAGYISTIMKKAILNKQRYLSDPSSCRSSRTGRSSINYGLSLTQVKPTTCSVEHSVTKFDLKAQYQPIRYGEGDGAGIITVLR